eukprot:10424896-Prorocentrum_lima.AAC.1
MTSSLVGSEMCIRDRRPAAMKRPTARSKDRSPWKKGKDRGPKSRARTVSYTHLTLPTICSV